MSIPALIISMALESFSPGPNMLACTFPASESASASAAIRLRVEALPSLTDSPNMFRIRLHLDGASQYRGLAGPIDKTDARDVLIRARTRNQTYYTIGLRDDGKAALNLLRVEKRDAQPVQQETREGSCSGFAPYIDTWLTS